MNAVAIHVWQSTWFAMFAALLVLLVRKESARIRFVIWFAASLKFLIPFSWLTAIGGVFSIQTDQDTLLPLVREVAAPLQVTPIDIGSLNPMTAYPLYALWFLGTCFCIGRWLMRWRELRLTVDASIHQGTFRSLPIRLCGVTAEPGQVGLFRPAIVLPKRLVAELSPRQIHAICVHEWMHARRHDNLTAAIQALIQAIFWFHPLVWWLGSRLLETREQACDEAVIADGSDPETYAHAMLSVCRSSLESRLACAAAVTGGDLKARVKDILQATEPAPLSGLKCTLLCAVGTVAVAAPVIAGVNVLPRWPNTLVTMPFVADLQASAARRSLGEPPAFEVHRDRLSVRNLTLRELVAHAYSIDASEVHSSLSWFDERYDIDVRFEAPLALDDRLGQRYAIREALARHFNVQIFMNRRCEEPCGRAGLYPER
jgi:beta-lactamase regulating signal transducer with metallopeptidase domain